MRSGASNLRTRIASDLYIRVVEWAKEMETVMGRPSGIATMINTIKRVMFWKSFCMKILPPTSSLTPVWILWITIAVTRIMKDAMIPIKVKVLVKGQSFCCSSVSSVLSYFSSIGRVEFLPTQATTTLQEPLINYSSEKRKGFYSDLGWWVPSPFSVLGSMTSQDSDLTIMQSAGTISPALRVTTSPTTRSHMSTVCIWPFLPRFTANLESLFTD